MTNLLILNGLPKGAMNPHYRGIYRRCPTHCDHLPEAHEINQLFMWFLEEGGESGVMHNLAKARRYCELCNIHFPDQHFELIEITDGERGSTTNGTFLGFDLSAGYDASLLYQSLGAPAEASMVSKEIAILTDVINRLFVPRLNQYGLFQTFDDASLCRQAMIALQSFHPGLYEGGNLDVFKITGVHAISHE